MTRYSFSSLQSFDTCPQQYKFAKIDKVQVPKRLTADVHLGNIIHRAVSVLYKHGADGIVYPLDKILDDYNYEWENSKKETLVPASEVYTIDDYIRIGREMLERFHEKYRPFNDGTLIGSEMNIYFELPGTSFKFTARLDMVLKKDNGTVEIRDYKTGKRIHAATDKTFYYQMGLYNLALQSRFPQYRDIELTEHFLRHNEIVSRKLSGDELDQITQEFRNAVLEIKNAVKLNDFPTREGGHCSYCEFFEICPAKRHGKMLEGKDAFEDLDEQEKVQKMHELATRYIELKDNEKVVKNEINALKDDLVQIARDTGLTGFEGDGGKVSVSLKQAEKFVTKTEDADAFAALVTLARQLGLDEFMTVDANALYKEGVAKERLPEDALKELREFIRVKEESTVRVTKPRNQKREDG